MLTLHTPSNQAPNKNELITQFFWLMYVYGLMKNGVNILIIGVATLIFTTSASNSTGGAPVKVNNGLYNEIKYLSPYNQHLADSFLNINRLIVNKTVVYNDSK